MRTTLLRPVWLLMAALLLVACTRDRPTPEPTPTAAAVTPVSATPSKADPVVETAGKTPSPAATTTAETTLTPEAPSTRTTFDYTVKSGDTLADIATTFQTAVQTLRELNFLLDDNIRAGQVLAVPYIEGMTAEGAPTPTPTPFTYVVQAGDSLSSIAIQFDIKSMTLVEVNNITDPNNLAVGTELLIPGYVAAAPLDAEPNAATDDATSDAGSATTTTTGSASSSGGAVVHVIQLGETMGEIAAEYGVDAAAIAAANGISNGNLIRVGQKLIIPGISKQDALAARGQRYVVLSGESLSGIAEKFGVSVEVILAANGLDDPNKIIVGQELLIPPQE